MPPAVVSEKWRDMTETKPDFEETIKKLAEWLKSDEGKAHMEKVRQNVERIHRELEEATRVPDEVLHKRVTI